MGSLREENEMRHCDRPSLKKQQRIRAKIEAARTISEVEKNAAKRAQEIEAMFRRMEAVAG